MKSKKLHPYTQVSLIESSKAPCENLEVIEMKVMVEAIESALANKELARKLVNLILLPRDQKEWGSQIVEDVPADIFP